MYRIRATSRAGSTRGSYVCARAKGGLLAMERPTLTRALLTLRGLALHGHVLHGHVLRRLALRELRLRGLALLGLPLRGLGLRLLTPLGLGVRAGLIGRADLLQQRRERVGRERGRASALVLVEGERELALARELARARDVQDRALPHLAVERHELEELDPRLAQEDLAHARVRLEALVGLRPPRERLEAAAAAQEDPAHRRGEDGLVPGEELVGPDLEGQPPSGLEAREEGIPVLHERAELQPEAHFLTEEAAWGGAQLH